jgi:hypothetical protein
MSEDEVIYLPNSGNGGKARKKTRTIIQGDIENGHFFYQELYKLAAELYNMMNHHRDQTFSLLPKEASKTSVIHLIGQTIAEKWTWYNRADIHNIGRDIGFMDLIQDTEYVHH